MWQKSHCENSKLNLILMVKKYQILTNKKIVTNLKLWNNINWIDNNQIVAQSELCQNCKWIKT